MAGSHKGIQNSVTSRRDEMKRSWRDKLDPYVVEVLEHYRNLDDTTSEEEYEAWIQSIAMPREYEGHKAILPHRIRIKMLMLQMNRQLNAELWPKLANLELKYLPDPQVGAVWSAVEQLAKSLCKMNFGNKPLDEKKIQAVAAQLFCICENACRGRDMVPKGIKDIERADLINFLWTHEKEQLSWNEVRQALEHAGHYASEDLRVWECRARKDGLVQARKVNSGRTTRKKV